MNLSALASTGLLALLATPADTVSLSPQDTSLRLESTAAAKRGLDWLRAQQKPEGYWSNPDLPALTALALTSLLRHGANPDDPAVKKGLDWLVAQQQPDGGIYKPDSAYFSYNTALSVLALHAANRPEDHDKIRAARAFLATQQNDFGEPGMGDHPLDGGIGYGRSRNHADLSNTVFALEALRATQALDTDKPQVGPRLNWEAALRFVSRCQNLPSHNDQAWVSDDPANRGGFVYHPGYSMAGEMELPGGRVALRSYGSMSYAGLLSMIYAEVNPQDPRIVAVHEWLQSNYTLDENPGMGSEGLYYYYHLMAKALATIGATEMKTPDGPKKWRPDLAKTLINRQKPDGFWINDDKARWMEQDPVLVTSYVLLALGYTASGL
ncbi:MAG: terpene cyclase/mutase family protein [Candidatus Methylacidiphilales bacterium]